MITETVDIYLVIDGHIRPARMRDVSGEGSITVDLYRNLDDFRLGVVMEHDFTYEPGATRLRPTYRDCSGSTRLGSSSDGSLRCSGERYGRSRSRHGRRI